MQPDNRHRTGVRLVWWAWLLLCCIPGVGTDLPAQAAAPVAEQDFVTPEPLVVVDAATTIKERALEGEYMPLVLRHRANAADDAEAQLRAAFERTRDHFLDALERTFGERQIGIREINSARFRAFRSEFQSGNPLMPVNLVLAQTWAKGYDGAPTLDRLTGALRATMENHLIGEPRPASTVFLADLDETVRIKTWGEASRFAKTVEADAILSIEEAGLRLRRGLDALDRIMGGFVSGMIQPNVVEDEYLTSLVIGERLGGRAVVRRYRPGEVIARKGEPLDRWSMLALEAMRRGGIEMLDQVPARMVVDEESEGEVGGREVVDRSQPVVPWWMILCAGVVIAAGSFVFFALRKRVPSQEIVATSANPADLKEAVAPHLARELKNKLVQALYSQRGALLANEESASQRVAELEERLAKLQPAIAEKIRGYERRIAALEAQLEEKDQETRDLIRAKLVLARKELDEEIARNRIRWNN